MVLPVDKPKDISARTLEDIHSWKLEDAKAQFSEVVRLARDQSPQRVTVRGEDAVVILSAEDFSRLLPWLAQPSPDTAVALSEYGYIG